MRNPRRQLIEHAQNKEIDDSTHFSDFLGYQFGFLFYSIIDSSLLLLSTLLTFQFMPSLFK